MHYADELDGANAEQALADITRRLLRTNRIWLATSECALFEDIKLRLTEEQEGIPSCPASFMPYVWREMITHTVVLYIADGEGTRRGALVQGKDLKISSAGELCITDTLVTLRGQGLLSATQLL